ncbi:MAG TPA: hypothetical protein PKD37_05205 [Oligoflexia bacterium]|nr:hypothetical protein [Oligoflexia bacterium]HMP27364.1 hypothetical protein [Oligoflexia bacterium]
MVVYSGRTSQAPIEEDFRLPAHDFETPECLRGVEHKFVDQITEKILGSIVRDKHSLEGFTFQTLEEGLKRTVRWSGYWNKERLASYNRGELEPAPEFRDATLLGHLLNLSGVIERFLKTDNRFGKVDPLSAACLRLNCWLHDLGETIVGDIMNPVKNQNHEQLEKESFLSNIKNLLPFLDGFEREFVSHFYDQISAPDRGSENQTNDLHRTFRYIEKIDWARSALCLHHSPPMRDFNNFSCRNSILYGDFSDLREAIDYNPRLALVIEGEVLDFQMMIKEIESEEQYRIRQSIWSGLKGGFIGNIQNCSWNLNYDLLKSAISEVQNKLEGCSATQPIINGVTSLPPL